MARPPKKPTPQHDVQLDTEALARASQARDELAVIDHTLHAQSVELAQRLGYDGPLQPELLELGVAQSMRRTAEACLETGKLLLLLKERVGHGAFLESLERLQFAPRAAQKYMQAALKLSNAPTSAHLKLQASQSKLVELLVLDDDEIKGLAEGDSVRGITLDKVDTMTVRELRAALRESEENLAAKDQLIETKNAKIDKLLTAKKFKPSPESIAQTAEQQAQLEELAKATTVCHAEFNRLADVVGQIGAATESRAMRGRAVQAVQYLVQVLIEVIEEHGIEIDLANPVSLPLGWGMPGLMDDQPPPQTPAAPRANGKGH
ncbi:MAG: hypothetical protein HS128_19310 [Ideonella sp.]|nr:hypothetical protein [Ideonella sp.]MCC7455960.1 hypothetical protein [Nitrospira sp.]